MPLLRDRITVILFVLVASIGVSLWIGHDVGLRDSRSAASAIVLIAFIKARFIILDFMELRHAPRGLRFTAEGWVVGMAAILITLVWWAPENVKTP